MPGQTFIYTNNPEVALKLEIANLKEKLTCKRECYRPPAIGARPSIRMLKEIAELEGAIRERQDRLTSMLPIEAQIQILKAQRRSMQADSRAAPNIHKSIAIAKVDSAIHELAVKNGTARPKPTVIRPRHIA